MHIEILISRWDMDY